MIFGFNTDIKHENTVYHVQSEAREGEHLLQTQIFVRGQCIGKKAASYAELVGQREFSDDRMHEMLKFQHRSTIDDLRSGRVDEALTQVTPLAVLLAEMTGTSGTESTAEVPKSSTVAQLSAQVPSGPPESSSKLDSSLHLEFLNPDAIVADHALVLRFRVLEDGTPISGAKLIARLTKVGEDGQEHDPVYAQNQTEPDGEGAMSLVASVEDMGHAIVLIQATHNGKSAMKKFRLKSPG
jgi:hypothetical protein